MASIGKDNDLRSFDVPEISRHAGGYTIYKIVLQVTPKELTENSYQVVYWKRYSDIRKLYDVLHHYHQAIYRPGKFPPFPEKSGYMERFNPTIIEQRRIATKEFLNFAIQQLYLRTHDAYIKFFQNGEKVLLPDVETDILKPESMISQQTPISAPILPTPVELPTINEKKNDLLLDIDEDKAIENVNNTSTKVLEDLNDLKFEQNDFLEIEPADLISVPSATTPPPPPSNNLDDSS